jgi:hypothetical protein
MAVVMASLLMPMELTGGFATLDRFIAEPAHSKMLQSVDFGPSRPVPRVDYIRRRTQPCPR